MVFIIIKLQTLTEQTKKQNFEANGFEMTENIQLAFHVVKDEVMMHTSRVRMNPLDPLILYTGCINQGNRCGFDASTRCKREAMRFRLSHAIRVSYEMGVMEKELFAFVFCVKSLSPYLLGNVLQSERTTRTWYNFQIRLCPFWSNGGSCCRSSDFRSSTSWIPECGCRWTHE